MEKEINSLKESYEKVNAPYSLEKEGLDDLWMRVENTPKFTLLYSRTFISFMAVLLLFTSVVGVSSAFSEPGSVLYPLKKHGQNSVNSIMKAVSSVDNTETPRPIKLSPTSKVSPTSSPTPTHFTDSQDKKEVKGENTQKNNFPRSNNESHTKLEEDKKSNGDKNEEKENDNKPQDNDQDKKQTSVKKNSTNENSQGNSHKNEKGKEK